MGEVKKERLKEVRYHLKPVVRLLWAIYPTIAFILAWIMISLILEFHYKHLFGLNKKYIPLMVLVPLLILYLLFLLYNELRYRNCVHYFKHSSLIIEEGVFRKEKDILPYEKIQNIHVERSLFDRLIGTATIEIETAGNDEELISKKIYGINNYIGFINELLSRIEYHKGKGGV